MTDAVVTNEQNYLKLIGAAGLIVSATGIGALVGCGVGIGLLGAYGETEQRGHGDDTWADFTHESYDTYYFPSVEYGALAGFLLTCMILACVAVAAKRAQVSTNLGNSTSSAGTQNFFSCFNLGQHKTDSTNTSKGSVNSQGQSVNNWW